MLRTSPRMEVPLLYHNQVNVDDFESNNKHAHFNFYWQKFQDSNYAGADFFR